MYFKTCWLPLGLAITKNGKIRIMIVIKSEKEIMLMREGGKILGGIMKELEKMIEVGRSTGEIDQSAENMILSAGGRPVFKGYEGSGGKFFPGTICASINQEVVHGIPSFNRVLKPGDILKIDIGMRYGGMITDMARTFPVGAVSGEAAELLAVTRKALDEGIKKLRNKGNLSKYSEAVQEYVEKRGFSVVRELVGHGVGRRLHEDPFIPNYKTKEEIKLRKGMTLALEPMINAGSYDIKLMDDGWTYSTIDGRLSAHFEDTVVILEDSIEILTRL